MPADTRPDHLILGQVEVLPEQGAQMCFQHLLEFIRGLKSKRGRFECPALVVDEPTLYEPLDPPLLLALALQRRVILERRQDRHYLAVEQKVGPSRPSVGGDGVLELPFGAGHGLVADRALELVRRQRRSKLRP